MAALGSVEALVEQGAHPERINERIRPLETPIKYNTANGVDEATMGSEIEVQGTGFTTTRLVSWGRGQARDCIHLAARRAAVLC